MSVTIDREDIIRMAREAGISVFDAIKTVVSDQDGLERFAALVASRVAAHVRETEFNPDWSNYQQGVKDGAAAEREACAELCVKLAVGGGFAADCAAAIRARGETLSRGQA